jgi:hypothetical protein
MERLEGVGMSETRKLAAILVAEVVGYSRLAGADEDRILARLRTLRSDLIESTIAVHHGRIVKRTGDGTIHCVLHFEGASGGVNRAAELNDFIPSGFRLPAKGWFWSRSEPVRDPRISLSTRCAQTFLSRKEDASWSREEPASSAMPASLRVPDYSRLFLGRGAFS